jgi:hypothetical protein
MALFRHIIGKLEFISTMHLFSQAITDHYEEPERLLNVHNRL